MMMRTAILALSGLVALPTASAAMSAEEYVRVSLRPGWVEPDGTRFAGIEITLAPGWHTYWRQPGDAGIPPMLDLSGSQNLDAVKIHWPVPVAFDQNGLLTLGYAEQVVLPLELTPGEDSAMQLDGRFSIGVCNEICIPAEFTFSVTLDGAGQPDTAIQAALRAVPDSASVVGFADATCDADPIRDGLRVTVGVEAAAAQGVHIAVIETGDPTIWVSSSETSVEAGQYRVSADLVPENAQPFLLDRSEIRLTLLNAGGALEFLGCAPR